MKSLFIAFLLIFSTVDVGAFQVFGGGAASTLDGQNGPFYLDLSNHTGDSPASSFSNYSAEFGSLHQEEDAESSYNLSTSFMAWTSMNEATSSSGITASTATHDITVGPAGVYDLFFHASYQGSSGDEITLAMFLNDTTIIDEVIRTQAKGATHFPAFINLSSATYDTFSAVDRLFAADADLLTINETTATPGFIIEFIFTNVISPLEVEFDNVGYDGSAGHLVEGQVWNDNLSQWDELRTDTGDFPHTGSYGVTTAHLRGYDIPEPNADYVNASGEVKIRLIHTSAGTAVHDMIFDKVFLTDGFSGAVVASKELRFLNDGDKISLKIKDGANGIINIKHMGLKIDRLGN